MAFFNEFPHTRTYDSDLAWLIKRMKEVLSRMESVEARMQAVEELVRNFLDTADDLIREIIQAMIDDGTFAEIIASLIGEYGTTLYTETNNNIGFPTYSLTGVSGSILNIGLAEDIAPRYTQHTKTSGELVMTMNTLKTESIIKGTALFPILDAVDVAGLPQYINNYYDVENSFKIGQLIPFTAVNFDATNGLTKKSNVGAFQVTEYRSDRTDPSSSVINCPLVKSIWEAPSEFTGNMVQTIYTVKLKRKIT